MNNLQGWRVQSQPLFKREYFLAHEDGRLAPDATSFLSAIKDEAWTYELSACQVEHRTQPQFADTMLHLCGLAATARLNLECSA